MIVRPELLKAALADEPTRARLHIAKGPDEIEQILSEFAKKRSFNSDEGQP